ncbi:MAG: hypothetical protein SFW67_36125 [Myxococcaceae bacterium]|nr:hypothetical protein [Myxococcaceae bacterium]
MRLVLVSLLWGSVVLGAERTPRIAWWVSHHDVPPPSSAPWRETAELPRLVLYDDGLVVVTDADGRSRSTTLPPEARGLMTAGGDAFLTLPDVVQGTRQMHPTVEVVTRWSGSTRKTVRFFGSVGQPNDRALAPAPLLEALDALAAFKDATLTPYVPEQVVVRACPTDAAPTGAWPKGWPLPQSGSPVLERCFQHLLPERERARAEGLSKKRAFAVVRHESSKWLVTLVRCALPAEAAWAGR